MLEHMVDTVLYFEGNVIIYSSVFTAVKTVLVQPVRLGFLRCSPVVWQEVLNLARFS